MTDFDSAERAAIRRARAEDARALAALRAASLTEQGLLAPGDGLAFAAEAEAGFARLLREGRLDAWLLIAHGAAAGCASTLFWERLPYAETALHAELAGVYVVPAFRRRGFARDLCRRAIAAARGRGARRISVHPSPSGAALYRELGFVDGTELRLA